MSRSGPASLLPILVPVLLFLALYGRSLDYDFVWTDQGEIEVGLLIVPASEIGAAFARPMLSDLGTFAPGATQSYYRPMQVAAVSLIDHHLGRTPRNFRALNLALGALTSGLLAWIALALGAGRGAALFAGSLFAVHPANLENYVWIAGSSHALMAFFLATSLLCALACVRSGSAGRALAFGSGSLAALLLSLLSKENAAVGPLMWLAALVCLSLRLRREEESASAAGLRPPELRGAVLFAAQALLLLVYFAWWRPRVLGGALAEVSPLGGFISLHILTAMGTWPDALAWLALPLESTTSDVVRVVRMPTDPQALVAAGLAGGSLWLVYRFLRDGRETAALALAWIWIAYLPTSGLVPLNHMRGERYLSLSLFGLALLWPSLARALPAGAPENRRRAVIAGLGVLCIAGLAQRSWQRMPDWRSQRSLFQSDVARDPLYREGYHELAKAYVTRGDYRSAKRTLKNLSELGPAFAGHHSYLHAEGAVEMYCRLSLALEEPSDALPFFADLDASSARVRAAPQLAICGALVLDATGDRERAVRVLEAIYELAIPGLRSAASLELAKIHAEAGESGEATKWLRRVEPSELQMPEQRGLYERVERTIRRSATR